MTDKEKDGPQHTPPTPVRRDNIMGGVMLIVLGGLFLANNLIPHFDFSDYWPLILVAIGIGLIWKSRQSS